MRRRRSGRLQQPRPPDKDPRGGHIFIAACVEHGAVEHDASCACERSAGTSTAAACCADRIERLFDFISRACPQRSWDWRSDQARGFVVLPKRWIVERTLAWLNRCRRLTKDWENLNRTALAFLRLASIRLMLRKLCNPH
jgi:transposase